VIFSKKLFFNRNFWLGNLGVAFFLWIFFPVALAQTPEELGIPTGVQVSPVRFDWDLKAGEEKLGIINLKNFSDSSYEVEVQTEDFYVSDDTTEAQFFVPNANHPLYAYDVINWIAIDNKIILAPKEGKDIYFKVKVPEGTPTGGYYGALFFKTQAQALEGENATKIMVNQRVGVLLVMAVKGDQPIIQEGKVQNFSAKKKIFWDKPVEFTTEIINTGNLHFKALGNLEINKWGRKMNSLEMPNRVVYPGKYRTYENQWDFSPWSYGFYRAELKMASEDGQILLNGETSFWVIPWKTTLAILLLLAIIILVYRIFNKKFEIRRKDEPEEK
jgi:hypothetical protein